MDEHGQPSKTLDEDHIQAPPEQKTPPHDPHPKEKMPPDGEIIGDLGDAVGGPA